MTVENTKYIIYLLELSKRGRQRGFLELCQINLRNVFTIAFRLLYDTELAKKVTVNTFLKAWEEIKLFDIRKPFVDWIKHIAVGLAIEETTNFPEQKNVQPSKSTFAEIPYLENLINALPVEDRIIFVLHDIEGYSYEQINFFFKEMIIDEIKTKLIQTRQYLISRLEL